MDNLKYENQGTNTYLVYTIGENDDVDTMSLGMLTNNKIDGLAPTIFTQMNTTEYLKYNVSAKVSVKQFFEGTVNKKRLLGVFRGIVDAMLSAEDYMLDCNSIILDLDYIFADVSTCETILICLPLNFEDKEKHDMQTFFKNIMFNTKFDQAENCDYVARIINYLNSSSVFSMSEFSKLLSSIEKQKSFQSSQPVVTVINNNVGSKTFQQPQPRVSNMPTQFPQNKNQKTLERKPLNQQQIPQNPQNMQSFNNQNQPPVNATNEKQMSWFYLMQHYNKENSEKYKAQKANKKSKQQNNYVPNRNVNYQQSNACAPKSKAAHTNVSFAVPGQMNNSQMNKQAEIKQPPVVNRENTLPQQKVPVYASSAQAPQMNRPNVSSAPIGRPASFGETTVLGGASCGETTVLNANSNSFSQQRPYLVRIKNETKIIIDKPVFRIGKERSYVDYFIGDNPAISRSHANILSRDNKYFIVDTNSTNHTYIDGNMLQSNNEYEIANGSKIRLGNEDFEFKLI